MESLQKKTLDEYKRIFPKDSLKIISKKTNIQITRVFRIFNGSEMKVKELESFLEVLGNKPTNLFTSISSAVPPRQMKNFSQKLERAKKKMQLISANQSFKGVNTYVI